MDLGVESLALSHGSLEAPAAVRELVKVCVYRNPKRRPSFVEIAEILSGDVTQPPHRRAAALDDAAADDDIIVDDYLAIEAHDSETGNENDDFTNPNDGHTSDADVREITLVTNRAYQ